MPTNSLFVASQKFSEGKCEIMEETDLLMSICVVFKWYGRRGRMCTRPDPLRCPPRQCLFSAAQFTGAEAGVDRAEPKMKITVRAEDAEFDVELSN